MPRVTDVRDPRLRQLLDDLPELSLEEFERCLELSRLVRDAGVTCPRQVLADAPVHVGHTTLYQPTLGALEWLRQTLADGPCVWAVGAPGC